MNAHNSMNSLTKRLKLSLKHSAKIGLILGSGWSVLDNDYFITQRLSYARIPEFPLSTVAGHRGELILARLRDIPLVILSGRVHLYEGYSAEAVTRPVRILAGLGVKTLIITNAAGAVNPDFSPGDIMLITDQINLQFKTLRMKSRIYPDLHGLYDKSLVTVAEKVAQELRIAVRQGVYAGVTGPNYETAAEVRMLRIIGADAVGMSTVLESTAAAACGLKVLGISCLVNRATGLNDRPLRHSEVLRVMKQMQGKLRRLIKAVVRDIAGEI